MSEEATPKWRKDFPIEWGVDNYITRREFTKFLVLASGASFLGNGFFVLKKAQQQNREYPAKAVAGVEEVSPGQAKLFRYPTENDPALLIRQRDGSYTAYLQRCTHLSCPVLFQQEDNTLRCPCHNGAFDAASGKVLSGPPPRPLPRILLREDAEGVWAVGLAGPEDNESSGGHA